MRPVLVAIVLCLAAACGQKGSLYLRDDPPPGVKPPRPQPSQPVPYPKDPSERTDEKK
jgi:predicted small lipoprotein YifL